MNKQEIIKLLASRLGTSQPQAANAANALLGIIGDALSQGRDVTIPDFGKFSVKTVPQRQGVNPATGERITIPKHSRILFKSYGNIGRFSFKYDVK